MPSAVSDNEGSKGIRMLGGNRKFRSEIVTVEILQRSVAVRCRLYLAQQAADDIEGGKSFALCLEIGNDAMTENGWSQRSDIFDGNRIATLEDRPRLSAQD